MDTNDEGWLDPGDDMGIWEDQGRPLTVGELRRVVGGDVLGVQVEGYPEVPVGIEYYDGTGNARKLRPMHIDARGARGRATAIVITVA